MNKIFSPQYRNERTVFSSTKRIPIIIPLKTIILIIICNSLLNVSQTVEAQGRRIVPFISGGINFDGIPDEEIWKKAESFPLVMHSPNNGKIPEQKTDVRLCYDEMYLYNDK